jgi:hypothetical protein
MINNTDIMLGSDNRQRPGLLQKGLKDVSEVAYILVKRLYIYIYTHTHTHHETCQQWMLLQDICEQNSYAKFRF